MFKKLGSKLAFLLAIIFAAAVGGMTTAFVMAAIPDEEGMIHACYRTSGLLANGQLRIIDSASEACNTNETELTWNQTGPQGPPGSSTDQVSVVGLNSDGTINTEYSQGVNNIAIIETFNPDVTPSEGYRICFNLAEDPVYGTSNGGGSLLVSSTSVSGEAEEIADFCGPGFNALSGEAGRPSAGGQPYDQRRFVFFYIKFSLGFKRTIL